jgi:hypothetical protein
VAPRICSAAAPICGTRRRSSGPAADDHRALHTRRDRRYAGGHCPPSPADAHAPRAPSTVKSIVLAVSAAEPNQTSDVIVSTTKPLVGAPIDVNGTLTADGTRTFEWDARNQLVAVNAGTLRSEFFCDGKQRRVRIVGKESGVMQSDVGMLWCGAAITAGWRLGSDASSHGDRTSCRHQPPGDRTFGARAMAA